jgi:hypothetical protein
MSMATASPAPIELNNEGRPEQGDTDSSFDEESQYTDTESVRSSIFSFRKEHGRTYHAFGSTEHWGPNDDSAQDQQDISHHMWSLMLRGELYIAPIEKPHVSKTYTPPYLHASFWAKNHLTSREVANLGCWDRNWYLGYVSYLINAFTSLPSHNERFLRSIIHT